MTVALALGAALPVPASASTVFTGSVKGEARRALATFLLADDGAGAFGFSPSPSGLAGGVAP